MSIFLYFSRLLSLMQLLYWPMSCSRWNLGIFFCLVQWLDDWVFLNTSLSYLILICINHNEANNSSWCLLWCFNHDSSALVSVMELLKESSGIFFFFTASLLLTFLLHVKFYLGCTVPKIQQNLGVFTVIGVHKIQCLSTNKLLRYLGQLAVNYIASVVVSSVFEEAPLSPSMFPLSTLRSVSAIISPD